MPAPSERLPASPRDRADLAALLGQAVEATGLTAREAARQLGVCPSTVSQWCSGDREPPAAALLWALRSATPGRRRALLELLSERLWGAVAGVAVDADDEADGAVVALSEAAAAIVRARRGGIEPHEVDDLRGHVRRVREHVDALDVALDGVEQRSGQTTFGCRRAR